MLCVEAFAVRFLVEPCVCRRWIIRGESESESDIFGQIDQVVWSIK
jgi:hypothetical protein